MLPLDKSNIRATRTGSFNEPSRSKSAIDLAGCKPPPRPKEMEEGVFSNLEEAREAVLQGHLKNKDLYLGNV